MSTSLLRSSGFVAVVLAAITLSAPLQANDWAVSRIKYENDGAFSANFELRSLKARGSSASGCNLVYLASAGESVTIPMVEAGPDTSKFNCTVAPGSEVWGKITILLAAINRHRSCRKDKARYFFHPKGGTMTVFTKGTVTNNNRCRIKSNGRVRWNPEVHGDTIYTK